MLIFKRFLNYLGGIKIFDDADARSMSTNMEDFKYMQWGADASTMFGTGELRGDLFVFSATVCGVAVSHDFAVGIGDTRLHFDAGTKLVYSEAGHAVDRTTGLPVGTFSVSGPMVPDSTLNTAFFLVSGAPSVAKVTHF